MLIYPLAFPSTLNKQTPSELTDHNDINLIIPIYSPGLTPTPSWLKSYPDKVDD